MKYTPVPIWVVFIIVCALGFVNDTYRYRVSSTLTVFVEAYSKSTGYSAFGLYFLFGYFINSFVVMGIGAIDWDSC